jgi:secreted trypsin-like serine protease
MDSTFDAAAHCFQRYKGAPIIKPERIKAVVGAWDLSQFWQRNGTGLDVKTITLHPEWAQEADRFDSDLAILELENRITFTRNIRRICLPEPNQGVINRNGTVVGYGLTETGSLSDIPIFAELTTKNALNCVLKDPAFATIVSGRMFCAGEPGLTACKGDSGSSFTELNEIERFTVIGVVSSTIIRNGPACNPDVPTAYTSIPFFVDWIMDIGIGGHLNKSLKFVQHLFFLFQLNQNCQSL